MAQSALTAKTGQNFAVADLGQFSQLLQFTFKASEASIKILLKLRDKKYSTNL